MKKNFQKTLADSLVAQQSQLQQTNFKNLRFKGSSSNSSVNWYYARRGDRNQGDKI